HWTWRENVFRLANIQRNHDELVAANPDVIRTPLYRQEWLGEWVVDASALVYRFDPQRNAAAELPKPRAEYTYVLGVDLGFTDPSALVVGAYHPNDPTLYVPYAHKAAGMTISDVAAFIKGLWFCPGSGHRGPYPFAAMVADASALQAVEEMRQHHRLPIEAAEKPGKRGVIEVMNSDLVTGRIKLLPEAMGIAEEWDALVWDERERAKLPSRWVEDPRFPNHLADAALYCWRKARAYDALPEKPTEPMPGTEAWEQLRHEREMARIARLRAEGPIAMDELPPWLREV
ncbi:MAG TPA: hypothetical protein VE987_14735, partial [Polyangiaceae bacterium]|nr:hypothetical protein [Polyangiaceae bacterium]